MKKAILVIFLYALIFCVSAEHYELRKKEPKDSTTNPCGDKLLVVRDRLTFDIYHTFWMGTPTQGDFKKFNPGFNVSAMWDFMLPQTRAISFGLGLGFTYNTQYSNCLLQYNSTTDITKYFVLPSSIEYKSSRMVYTHCNIPIEIRYRHCSGVKFSLGIRVGMVTGISHRYKGPDYDGTEGVKLNYKNKDFHNMSKFCADIYARVGWKAFGVYYSYQLNKVFENGKGPSLNPMNLGISISLF